MRWCYLKIKNQEFRLSINSEVQFLSLNTLILFFSDLIQRTFHMTHSCVCEKKMEKIWYIYSVKTSCCDFSARHDVAYQFFYIFFYSLKCIIIFSSSSSSFFSIIISIIFIMFVLDWLNIRYLVSWYEYLWLQICNETLVAN